MATSSGRLKKQPATSGREAPLSIQERLPSKPRFYVSEAAKYLSEEAGVPRATAVNRLYRAINRGEIPARRYLGAMMIERGDLLEKLMGEVV